MDWKQYSKNGKEMVDFIGEYLETIRKRRVFPDVKPGYMRQLLPECAPLNGEDWDSIFADIEKVIMPGVTHWQSPYMHAYFPALNSPASLLGDMLADAIGCLGFTWASSPACTELEIIVMDWLAKMIGLPDDFLHSKSVTNGGGVLQTTASEATFTALLAARTEAILRIKAEADCIEELDDAEINSRLVAYCSDQAHSSVEKAGLIGLVKMRYIESDDKLSLRGDKLIEAIKHDRDRGLIPFYICVTLGTTGACAFDNLMEIGPIAKSEDIWIHVDAAYAGTAFICPEFRKWMTGIEFVQSLAFNPSKWMLTHFDCTAMWVRNSSALHRTFNVEPLYLKHENSGQRLAMDFMHWQISLSKKFRSLKLWFVIRNYGVKGLQQHIRKGIKLAVTFEELIRSDTRFEIPAERHLGLVVFRLKGNNELTECLLKKLNSSGRLHCVPASLKGTYVIRFTVTSSQTTMADIQRDFAIIKDTANHVLKAYGIPENRISRAIPLAEIKKRKPGFGTSLLLSNSPMTPKIINASFVAIFDQQELAQEFVRHFGKHMDLSENCNSPQLRRKIKGLMLTDKQHSLDSRMDLMNTIMATYDISDKTNSQKTGPKTPRSRHFSCSSSVESLPGNSIEEMDENGELFVSQTKSDDNNTSTDRLHSSKSQ
ncbi:histidine decarboxylase-like [Oppia nitens]|uniref:histidine decarboxylase-like n=1 Tax=Oppia nitens TaxID=1686743 RepID=UPI0023DBCBE8|nr:histidine decarboxylase-like [Oppia nitens]